MENEKVKENEIWDDESVVYKSQTDFSAADLASASPIL